YDKDTLHPSLSPTMDIMVPSNFERLLFDRRGRNGQAVAERLAAFKASGKLSVADQRWTAARKLCESLAERNNQTSETIDQQNR
ncbi:threonine synthase, partial [Pseudomonas aeruginosa]